MYKTLLFVMNRSEVTLKLLHSFQIHHYHGTKWEFADCHSFNLQLTKRENVHVNLLLKFINGNHGVVISIT